MPYKPEILSTSGCIGGAAVPSCIARLTPVDAADPGGASPQPAWSIAAVWEEPLAELTATEVLQDSPVAIRAETLPSTLWTSAHVARLSSGLVKDRNRFVCMQLATMAGEQLQNVRRAQAGADTAALRRARSVFLSTLEAGGELIGAALHYPRAASKSKSGAAAAAGGDRGQIFPHVYVELICINQPGRGYGSMLLQHVEAFALSNAAPLLRAALDGEPGSAASPGAGPSLPPAAACCNCLRGIKLLSVESAHRFYSSNGFSEPDESKEMFKELASVGRRLMGGAPDGRGA